MGGGRCFLFLFLLSFNKLVGSQVIEFHYAILYLKQPSQRRRILCIHPAFLTDCSVTGAPAADQTNKKSKKLNSVSKHFCVKSNYVQIEAIVHRSVTFPLHVKMGYGKQISF